MAVTETPQLKAVIFDLDGILTDTSIFHAKSWGDLVRNCGHEPPPDLEERVKGISRMASLEIALGEHWNDYSQKEREELAAQKNDWYKKAVETITPANLFPGVTELFNDLKKNGIKIVLGSASKNSKAVLSKLGIIDEFDAIADGYEYKHGKPHPDVFLRGAEMVGADPSECVVLEDAAAGITAALDGGFVAVGMGLYESLRHCHHFINSLTELTADTLRKIHAQWCPALWTIARIGVEENKKEASWHTILSIGNGRIGYRGTIPELNNMHQQGMFLAGFFDRIERAQIDPDKWSPFMKYWGIADLAREKQIEVCLVKCPDFADMQWEIDGEKIDLTTGELLSLKRQLDMRTGMFCAEATWRAPSGKEMNLLQRRFADMINPGRVYIQYELEPLNFSGALTVTAGVNADTYNGWEKNPHRLYEVKSVEQTGANSAAVTVTGTFDKREAAFGTMVTILGAESGSECTKSEKHIALKKTFEIKQDTILSIDRLSVVALTDESKSAIDTVKELMPEGDVAFGEARIPHAECWKKIWEQSDIVIDGDIPSQIGIRSSIYNLIIAAPRDTHNVSIGAKGLTGQVYRGMVFWDTDIHMVPFFNFTQPEIAKNLLRFRCATIDGARAKAAKYGLKGAWYPWETGVSGEEECEKWLRLITHQSHSTSDIVYALGRYVDTHGDTEFMVNHAAEVYIETARFWISKAVEEGDEVSIPDAGGPDEFHVVGHDSAYVNMLARHNLELAESAIGYLQKNNPVKWEELKNKTGVTDEEIGKIHSYQSRIRTMRDENGLYEQCRDFFTLRDEITRDDGTSSPHLSQTVKQADVLMMLYLLPDTCTREELQVNWDYYEPRTIHASSLSHGVHGVIATELGLKEKAQQYMSQTLGMDVNDEMGNAAHGAHMAANGMSWQAVVHGYGGARPAVDAFRINPNLPANWSRLRFNLKWHGADFIVDITGDTVIVTNKNSSTADLPLLLKGESLSVGKGETVCR